MIYTTIHFIHIITFKPANVHIINYLTYMIILTGLLWGILIGTRGDGGHEILVHLCRGGGGSCKITEKRGLVPYLKFITPCSKWQPPICQPMYNNMVSLLYVF